MPDYKPDHLIARYLSNEATPAEQEQLFEWVARNTANQKVFNEYVALWSTRKPETDFFDVTRNLKKLNDQIDTFEATEKKRASFWNVWNMAAAITLLAVCGFALYLNGTADYRDHTQSMLTEFYSGNRIRTSVTLADSSVITLNSNSTLQYPEIFLGNSREVYLQGEAFFEIQKDSLRPFIIHTGTITTRVLGTSFNVNAKTDKIIVSVATGNVRVSDGATTKDLKPFEKATYYNHSFNKESTDLMEELAWKHRVMRFADTPLEIAAGEIEQQYNVTIRFEESALKKCLITGKFRDQDLETVLEAMEYSIGLQYETKNDTITFFGKGCQ
jgi:transmembrane sensor